MREPTVDAADLPGPTLRQLLASDDNLEAANAAIRDLATRRGLNSSGNVAFSPSCLRAGLSVIAWPPDFCRPRFDNTGTVLLRGPIQPNSAPCRRLSDPTGSANFGRALPGILDHLDYLQRAA